MIAIWAQQNHGLGRKGFFLSIGRCIFWILTETINFYFFIKYKFRCIEIYKYRVDQPAPETSLQENRMQQPKALTAGWSSSWSHSGVASCGPPRLCTAPNTARWSVYVCNIIRYKDNQRYTKYVASPLSVLGPLKAVLRPRLPCRVTACHQLRPN